MCLNKEDVARGRTFYLQPFMIWGVEAAAFMTTAAVNTVS